MPEVRSIYDHTIGIDGWVPIEVSPTLSYDTPSTIVEVKDLRTPAERPNHGSVCGLIAADGGDPEEMIAKFAKAGIDYGKFAADLQRETAESFVKDSNEMFASIALKSATFKAAG